MIHKDPRTEQPDPSIHLVVPSMTIFFKLQIAHGLIQQFVGLIVENKCLLKKRNTKKCNDPQYICFMICFIILDMIS